VSHFALLHGGGHGSWVWGQTVAALEARGGSALALDAPGCGVKRGRELAGIEVADIAAELVADIEAAGMSDVTLVGHSLAGTILPNMWRARPGLFRRLVYLACSAPLPGQSILEMMGKGPHGSDPDAVGWPGAYDKATTSEQRARMFCNDMDEAGQAWFVAQLGKDDWPAAATRGTGWRYDDLGPVPSTYIICEQDGILPVMWQHRFAQRLHCDRIVPIDAGHQAMNTQPETLADLLMEEAR
jgi:pimeloyl-ACP methyl ester carboxylesterase